MQQKVKVAFDVTNTWEYELFRNLIHTFVVEDDFFEVYLITQDPDTVYVNRVANNIGVVPANVFIETSDATIVARLATEQVALYLSANNPLVTDVNDTSTVTKCILVNNIPDRYRVQPLYITNMQFWLEEIRQANV